MDITIVDEQSIETRETVYRGKVEIDGSLIEYSYEEYVNGNETTENLYIIVDGSSEEMDFENEHHTMLLYILSRDELLGETDGSTLKR